ncbi:zinc finger protein 271-like [Hylaeus anthracinus]|uniref:zinc finger protein 271-like n=1 Tax=Hylaeus anthracinus TaxID=313031 RepID=UPI0023B8CCCE|nr:zinc finger protein 271-like [Hylaeus anthracinus]
MVWPNLRTQFAVSSFICPKCNAGFRRMWDLIRHKCGQIPRYACPYCHKKDNSSSNVYRHIRRWHPKLPVVWDISSFSKINSNECEQCGEMFAKLGDLIYHTQNTCCYQKHRILPPNPDGYNAPSSLDCVQCGKTFKRLKDVNYHIRHLCGIRGIQCPYCKKCYTYTSNVKYHINRYHKGKKVYYNKIYTSNARAVDHDYRRYKRKWNEQDFLNYPRDMKSLTNSYRYHPNERKRFECLDCGCRFTQKTTITRHLRYFCGQGHRYQCPYCEMRASCSSNIYRHVRSRHAGHKAHAIKLFDQVNSRYCQTVPRQRRKVYSVNKSHYCPRCNRGFTLKKNMTRHLRHECGMAPKYQCPYCEKPSKFTQNIYAHIRKYHPGQVLCFKRLY